MEKARMFSKKFIFSSFKTRLPVNLRFFESHRLDVKQHRRRVQRLYPVKLSQVNHTRHINT